MVAIKAEVRENPEKMMAGRERPLVAPRRNVGRWGKADTVQIVQLRHSDAEKKEEKSNLGKHRTYARPCSS